MSSLNTKKLACLVDADILVYHCGFSADAQMLRELKEKDSNASKSATDEWIAEQQYVNYALANTKTVLVKLQEMFDKKLKLYLTGSGNFRDRLATIQPYKGNRVHSHKPKYYKDITEYLLDFWDAELVNGREADDALGCAQWDVWSSGSDDSVIVSIDKDLDNIPGYHYNWRKENLYYIDLDEADRKFWKQVIIGDTTDNIRGLPGCGPVFADNLLADKQGWVEYYDAVLSAYKSKGHSEEAFFENASLLWIQRVKDLNFDDRPYPDSYYNYDKE